MSRDAHFESVAAAIESVGELGRHVVESATKLRETTEFVALIEDKQRDALSMIAVAVGDDPGTDSARNSIEFIQVFGGKLDELRGILATLDERVQELARICDNDVLELNRYLQGW